MALPKPPSSSPSWGSTTRLVVGLSTVAIVAALLIQFHQIIGPLILAFILAYLVHPVAAALSNRAHIPWRTSVNLIYIILVILLLASATATGFAVVQQVQSLIGFIERAINDLPGLVANLSTQVYTLGPFELNFAQLSTQLNLQSMTEQILATVQPLLGRVTGIISSFATSALGTLGWALFVILISYFLLADAGQVSASLLKIEVPGYQEDIQRISNKLKSIWNAFLRGQTIIFFLTVVTYTIVLTIMGLRYGVGIALLAGLARFVPYLGPAVTWSVTILVAYFQGWNYFGLEPVQYTILVIIFCIVLDQIFDNIVVPRFLGLTLGVHPAAVLVAAIIATRLIGIIGLVLAAPVLATLQLFTRYIIRKMFDLDPWDDVDEIVKPVEMPWFRMTRRLRAWWRTLQRH